MAKRRYKNKAKRALVGLKKKLTVNDDNLNKFEKMESCKTLEAGEKASVDDPCGKVQVTENGIIETAATENDSELLVQDIKSKVTNVQSKRKKCDKLKAKKTQKEEIDDKNSDEILIFPTEINGETCIDIQCGANEAYMYLERLCVGSRGACIQFADRWLTPNEFQMVSGRETAKDWKRSIRHKGRSLKLLISKGLITVQTISPKKANENDKKSSNKENKDKGNIENPGKEEKAYVAIESVPEPQVHQEVKKRGRKPKKQKGQRPADRGTDTGEETKRDKARPESDVQLASSGKTALAENASDKGVETKDNSFNETVSVEPADTRTEEERRLDEFVKSLRLTKTNGLTNGISKSTPADPVTSSISPSAPSLTDPVSPETDGSGTLNSVEEPVDRDPEMPVLQKEVDTSGYENDISVSVDALNSTVTTVTPPPTPPSERILSESKLRSPQQLEIFKATLASPSVGLKLTINREKVTVDESKPKTEQNSDCESTQKKDIVDINTVSVQKPEATTKAFLLQDALQSARKYKEQLQQSRNASPTKSVAPFTKVSAQKLEHSEHTVSRSDRAIPSVTTESKREQLLTTETKHKTARDTSSGPAVNKRHRVQPVIGGHMPSVEDIRRLSALSFKDFMSAMTSIYGPLPFSVDHHDSTMSSLQDFKHNYDMLHMLQARGSPQGAGGLMGGQSSLLYPMVTQQLLLAMTQQLYSMCSIPVTSATARLHTDSLNPRTSNPGPGMQHKREIQRGKSSFQAPPQNVSTKQPDVPRYKINTASPNMAARPDLNGAPEARVSHHVSTMKRKYTADDDSGVLDLSMKRPRHSINSMQIQPRPTSVQNIDGPLDFSMKRNHSVHYDPQTINTEIALSNYRLESNNAREPVKQKNAFVYPSYSHSMKRPGNPLCTCGSSYSDLVGWSVEQVCQFLQTLDGCASYVKTFHDQGISGRLLPYLSFQHLTRTLDMSTAAAMTLLRAVEVIVADRGTGTARPPCTECQKMSLAHHTVRT